MLTLVAILLLTVSVQCAPTPMACTEGACCDTRQGVLRPQGTQCNTGACYLPNSCTGDNPYCPTGGVARADGTVCPEGVCYKGKCKQATKCVADCCDKEQRALIEGAPCMGGSCVNGLCRALPTCMGQCCAADSKKPLEDGTPCAEGNCLNGLCTNLDKRCSEGKCCDQYKKLIRPKGFPCTNNPCAAKNQCDGLSENCAPPTHFKVDGTPCNKGVCVAGVCTENKNPTVLVDSTGKLVSAPKPAVSENKKKKPTGDAMEIHHHFVAAPSCGEGACCDVVEKRVFDEGRACANKTCFVGVCDGRSSNCAYVKAQSGTQCENGKCLEGTCIKNCIGQCCRSDGITTRPDGAVCSDGYCFAGTCVKSCKDGCCDTIHGVKQAKADGASCNKGDGYCVKGECRAFTVPVFQPRTDVQPKVHADAADVNLFEQSFKESFIKQFFRSAAKVEGDEIDEEERKLLEKQLNDTKTAVQASQDAENKAELAATMNSLALKSADSADSATQHSKSVIDNLTSGANLIFLVAGCVTAFVVFTIIVAALARAKKTNQMPDDAAPQEGESDYEKDYVAPTCDDKKDTKKEEKYSF